MNDERCHVLHDIDKSLNPNNMLKNWYNKAISIMDQAKTKKEYSRCLCIFNLIYNLDPFFLDCQIRIIECKKKIDNLDVKFEATTSTQNLQNDTLNRAYKEQKRKKINQVIENIAKLAILGAFVFLLVMFLKIFW